MNQKRFVTMFPWCENVHLIKDVGMIPFVLHKYYGYDAYIASYEDNFSFLKQEVEGLKIKKIKRVTSNDNLNGLLFLLREANNIDLLQLYHATSWRNYCWIALYKLLNPEGKVYLKMDTGYEIFERFCFYSRHPKNSIMRFMLRKIDLLSVETENLAEEIRTRWGIPVEYVTNGIYDSDCTTVDYSNKSNIICTVGRLGTEQKNTEELLEAFADFSKCNESWSLRLIGPIEDSFKPYIEAYMTQHPQLKGKVIFTGLIEDRNQIKQEYVQAKIFCLTSRWESFAIVLAEAMHNGCYIVSSEISGIWERTDNGRLGTVYPIEDKKKLVEALIQIANNEVKLKEVCEATQDFVYQKYYWPKICQKIADFFA